MLCEMSLKWKEYSTQQNEVRGKCYGRNLLSTLDDACDDDDPSMDEEAEEEAPNPKISKKRF